MWETRNFTPKIRKRGEGRMKLGLVILIGFILFLGSIFLFIHVPSENNYQLKQCKYFNIYKEVIYEDNLVYDKCIIIEDGEELTIRKYLKLDPVASERNPLKQTTEQMIRSYCRRMTITVLTTDNIVEFYEEIICIYEFYEWEQNNRKFFIAALVVAFMEEGGVEITEQHVKEVFNISLSNISMMKGRILDNLYGVE